MQDGITIRNFTYDDLNKCSNLIEMAWPHEKNIFLEDISEYVNSTNYYFGLYFVIAEADDKIVAMAILTHSLMATDINELQWVVTHPDYRKRGIAKKLIEMCKDRTLAEGKSLIFVTTEPEFYKKLGFTTIIPYGRGKFVVMDTLANSS